MALSLKDQKILWARAAGRCSFRQCGEELIVNKTKLDPAVMTGEMAHIIGRSKKGPRGLALPIDKDLRDSYENAILLCEKHHKIVDGQRNTYTVEILQQMKEEHERLVRRNPNFSKNRIYPIEWVVIIQQTQQTVDKKLVLEALKPDMPYKKPIVIMAEQNISQWNRIKQFQESICQRTIRTLPSDEMRFAIFSLTHIPLAIHLGYLINDRYRVRIYEYQRDLASWVWPSAIKMAKHNRLFITGLPKKTVKKAKPVIIRISISAELSADLTQKIVPDACSNIHIYIKNPAVNKIKHPSQVDNIGMTFGDVLGKIRKLVPDCSGIHLFYAGPCSCAVNIGRQINPTMNPPIYLYQYNAKVQPKHKHVLTLN